uniref:Uncharacterized protein n=1 Tax=Solanum lycopersicum TaxID=4081 RepID=A0A3Q7GYK3_SOLLC
MLTQNKIHVNTFLHIARKVADPIDNSSSINHFLVHHVPLANLWQTIFFSVIMASCDA